MTSITLRFGRKHEGVRTEDIDEMNELVIDYLFDQGFDVIVGPNDTDLDRHEYDGDEDLDLENLMNKAWDYALIERTSNAARF